MSIAQHTLDIPCMIGVSRLTMDLLPSGASSHDHRWQTSTAKRGHGSRRRLTILQLHPLVLLLKPVLFKGVRKYRM